MEQVDLGSVTVALAPLPSAGGQPASNGVGPTYRLYKDKGDPGLRELAHPSVLPIGVEFLDATVFESPVNMTIWTYADKASGKSVTLVRTPLDTLKVSAEGKPVLHVVGSELHDFVLGGSSAARVVVSRSPAWRGPAATLVWLKGDSVLQITGRSVSDDELVASALSL
jgi:hypothetical protein